MQNEKLAKFARLQVIRKSKTGGRGSVPLDALVTVTKSDENVGNWQVRFSLHSRAVKMLGWQVGDKVAMKITDEGNFVLFRDKQGRTLSRASSSSSRCYIRFSVVKEFYDAITPTVGTNVEIGEGMMAFCV